MNDVMLWHWWVATITAVLAFGSSAWAVHGHFRTEARMARGMAAITVFTAAGFCWWCWERVDAWRVPERMPQWADPLGSLIMISATVLFWWAVKATRARRLTLAYSKDCPQFVESSGPYALVRHPFYASYLLAWIGAAFEAPFWGYWVMPLGMGLFYRNAAESEEAKFEHSPLASDYRRYRSSTGMLFPRLWGSSGR